MDKEIIASLVRVKQTPIIEQRLSEIKDEFEKKAAEARAMVCTEQSRTAVKAMRADVRRDFDELENLRKAVKNAVLEPYNEFEKLYRQYVTDPHKSLDNELRDKIVAVEDGLKNEKYDKMRMYFNELVIAEGIEGIADFADVQLNITLSASEKSLRDTVKRFVEKLKSDLQLIQSLEDSAELLVEYRHNGFDANTAVFVVNERHRRIREISGAEAVCVEAATVEEPKVDPLPRPVVTDEKQYTVAFKVTATKEKLRELKTYLNNGGYTYE